MKKIIHYRFYFSLIDGSCKLEMHFLNGGKTIIEIALNHAPIIATIISQKSLQYDPGKKLFVFGEALLPLAFSIDDQSIESMLGLNNLGDTNISKELKKSPKNRKK